MKKILICLIALVAGLTLTGCEDKLKTTIKDIAELNEIDGVTMTIKKDTLTRTGATIIITDVSGKSNIYGDEYRLDKKVNGKWEELEVIYKGDYGWNLVGYTKDKNNKIEMDMNWEWLYGSLEDGEYRIVKDTATIQMDKKYSFSDWKEIYNNLNSEPNDDKDSDIKNYYFSVEFMIGE